MSVTRQPACHSARRLAATISVAVAAAATLALGTADAARAATVDVSFVEPAKFADAGRGSFETERTTKALAEIFQTYGKRLPASQSLKIEVIDVDLAGDLHWGRAAVNEIRVLRGRADWPRMELRYTLTENGRVLKSGEARLSDMTYLQHSLGPRYREPLGYEQRMIDEWITATFGPAAP